MPNCMSSDTIHIHNTVLMSKVTGVSCVHLVEETDGGTVDVAVTP